MRVLSYLKKLKQKNDATERQIFQFHQECLVFLLNTCLKIQERSPLKYPVVQYISCLCPEKIVSEPKTAQTRMSNLLMTLLEKKQISEICAEKSRKQFGELCTLSTGTLKSTFNEWDSQASSLDIFYASV